ncbi:hypothetical protein EVAR_8257_1 [Eumeta japonica]|uniref:Uncharacterized protein n=1 Tax=Eumeta variegata TaxID=151549 RepID=A0A4C1TIX7_EUMVA|nr:hypothetical protein EVAR_8257_1 [Eumeta japonica]
MWDCKFEHTERGYANEIKRRFYACGSGLRHRRALLQYRRIEYSIVYTLHGQLIRTIGAAILASTALTSSGRERLSLYPYSAADCNATCKRRRKSLRRSKPSRIQLQFDAYGSTASSFVFGTKTLQKPTNLGSPRTSPVEAYQAHESSSSFVFT